MRIRTFELGEFVIFSHFSSFLFELLQSIHLVIEQLLDGPSVNALQILQYAEYHIELTVSDFSFRDHLLQGTETDLVFTILSP